MVKRRHGPVFAEAFQFVNILYVVVELSVLRELCALSVLQFYYNILHTTMLLKICSSSRKRFVVVVRNIEDFCNKGDFLFAFISLFTLSYKFAYLYLAPERSS